MGRLILASPIALLVTLALFSLMAWMVDNGGKSIPKPTAALSFTMVMAEQEQDVQRRQRSVPEQPQSRRCRHKRLQKLNKRRHSMFQTSIR